MARILLTLLSAFVTWSTCINRPVYKIVLTQKGYSQFIQYDVETPPIREFTFCTWIRLYDLGNEQGLFSYVVHGSRIIRLWLDSGGHNMKVSFKEKPSSLVSIELTKDVWRHVCLTYQSDYGAWALYMDGRLVYCENIESLQGFVLPGGGSVIIGYGTSNVIPSGLEGEVFGVNMIFKSTIERNHTLKRDPLYQQKRFIHNKVRGNKKLKYMILGAMDLKNIVNNFETTTARQERKTKRNSIKFHTPYNFIDREIGIGLTTTHHKFLYESIDNEILDLSLTDSITDKGNINFWNLVNGIRNADKLNKTTTKQTGTGTQKHLKIFEFVTPLPNRSKHNSVKKRKTRKPAASQLYDFHDDLINVRQDVTVKQNKEILSQDVTSSLPEHKTKVYDQWTSRKFASGVLDYLKRINFYKKDPKKLSSTIPLVKPLDIFHTELINSNKVRPSLKFQRRNFVDKHIEKRNVQNQQINMQNVESRSRNNTLESDTLTHSKNVNVTNRRISTQVKGEHRCYRYVDKKIPDNAPNSKEVFKTNDIYSKVLSQGNKWHNVQTYNNDYTPRKIGIHADGSARSNSDTVISEANKKLPSVRLKYKPEYHKFVQENKDTTIVEGRALAKEVSNQSNKHDSISILKYNGGFSPRYRIESKSSSKYNEGSKKSSKTNTVNNKNNFNKYVKIANGLNERPMIGFNREKSVFESDDKIPDVNHRYKINDENEKISPSLGPRICKNVDLYEHVLYVQPDGSIDMTRIVSPVKDKNIGLEFLLQNYKTCSLQDSSLQNHPFLFIDWNKTPVRLFGGAYPKRTTDLCGFF